MVLGNLSCRCGQSKIALEVCVHGRRMGFICEDCVRDDYSLRTFIVAAGWLYDWKVVRFKCFNVAASGPLRLAVMTAIDEEESRAYECKEARLTRRLNWALGNSADAGRR